MGCSEQELLKTQRKGSPCPIKEGTLKSSGRHSTTQLVFWPSAWYIKAVLFKPDTCTSPQQKRKDSTIHLHSKCFYKAFQNGNDQFHETCCILYLSLICCIVGRDQMDPGRILVTQCLKQEFTLDWTLHGSEVLWPQ